MLYSNGAVPLLMVKVILPLAPLQDVETTATLILGPLAAEIVSEKVVMQFKESFTFMV